MMTRRAKAGFTLAELLVYIMVLSVFMLGMYASFTLGLNYFHNTRARSDAFGAAKVATAMIERVAATAASNSVQTQVSPPAVKFLSAQPTLDTVIFQTDTTGLLKYYRWVCIFLDTSTNQLRMSTQNVGSPGWTTQLPTAPSFATMQALSSRVIARDIASTGTSFTYTGTVLNFQITTRVRPSVANITADNQIGVTMGGQIVINNSAQVP